MSDDRVAGLVTYELLRTHGDLGNAETHKEILRALSSVPVDRESVQVLERFHATEYALLQVKALRATNDQVSKRRKQVREKWKGRQSVGLVKAATIQDVTQRFPKLFQGVMKDKMEHMVAVDEVKQRGKASLQTSAPVVATSPRVSTRGDLRSSTSRHAASFSMEKEAKAQNKAVLTDLVKKRPQPPHEDADMFNMNTRFKSPEQRNPFQTASERLLNDLMTSRSENMDVRRSKRRHGWREDSRIPPRGVYHPVNNDVLFGEGNKNEGCISSGGKKFISPVNSGIASKADAANIDVDPRLKSCDPELIEKIEMEIVDSGDPVTFDDIAGLQFAKKCVNELVIWPMHRPDIFTGLRSLPKGLLLFGPPGTGKTLIGKAIANQSGATFFNISASSLTSKWIGQGEKLVRTLFAVAAVKQPSVIFIDEIDSLLTQRSSEENESSRRMKTEFLVQLDGAGTKAKDIILVIGATNRPQELDEAARRRFVKRLYIPLPSLEARLDLVSRLLKGNKNDLTSEDIAFIAKATLGYSGADVRALCTEAAMGPIRNCSDIRTMRADSVRPISLEDFQLALRAVRSSVASKDLAFYKEWNEEFGSFAFENNEDSLAYLWDGTKRKEEARVFARTFS